MSPLIPHEGSIGYVIKVSNMKNFLCGLLLDLFIFLVGKCMVLKTRLERESEREVVPILMVGLGSDR